MCFSLLLQLTAMFHIATSGEHPPIPKHLSEQCKAFLVRCFAQRPDDRASAEELLRDPWLTKPRPVEIANVSITTVRDACIATHLYGHASKGILCNMAQIRVLCFTLQIFCCKYF